MHLRCRTGPSVQQGAATLLDLPMLGACVVSAGIEGVLADLIEARAEEVYPRDVFVPPTSDDLAEVNALLQRERGHQLDGIAAECYRRAYASIATQIRDGEIDITAALREHLLSDEVVERAALGIVRWRAPGADYAGDVDRDRARAAPAAALGGGEANHTAVSNAVGSVSDERPASGPGEGQSADRRTANVCIKDCVKHEEVGEV